MEKQEKEVCVFSATPRAVNVVSLLVRVAARAVAHMDVPGLQASSVFLKERRQYE